MFDCESNDKDFVLPDNDAKEDNTIINMSRDIRGRLFIHNGEIEINKRLGQSMSLGMCSEIMQSMSFFIWTERKMKNIE